MKNRNVQTKRITFLIIMMIQEDRMYGLKWRMIQGRIRYCRQMNRLLELNHEKT